MNDFGVRGFNPFSSPFGLRPVAAPRPAPIQSLTPIPLPPEYQPNVMPAMARRLYPGIRMLASMGHAAANVLPFAAPVAGVLDEAAKDTQTMGQEPKRPVSAAELTAWIRRTESNGNYQALNRESRGNTASGAYQYTDSTWNGYGGYPKALLAPKEVQDRRFAEDVASRLSRYNNDPFKAIAAHYLPALANNPAAWQQAVRLKNTTVQPVASYVRKVIRGTPLEAQFDEYLAAH